MRVTKKRPLTEVLSSPYTQLSISETVKAPPFHGSVGGGLILRATQTLFSRWFPSLESWRQETQTQPPQLGILSLASSYAYAPPRNLAIPAPNTAHKARG